MALLPIDSWLNIVSYLDVNDLVALAECYPHVEEIFYCKSIVKNLCIRELTNNVVNYIKKFPKNRKSWIETLDISFTSIKPKSAFESFIVSLSQLNTFWAFGHITLSSYKLIMSSIGQQLHTLGIHEDCIHQDETLELPNLKNLFIYARVSTNTTILYMSMISKLAKNVEYLWFETEVEMDLDIMDFPNLKELVSPNGALYSFHSMKDLSTFFLDYQEHFYFYKNNKINDLQIVRTFGYNHMKYTGFHSRYVNTVHQNYCYHGHRSPAEDHNLIGFAGSTCQYLMATEITENTKNITLGAPQDPPTRSKFREMIQRIRNTCEIFELIQCNYSPPQVFEIEKMAWNEYVLQDLCYLTNLQSLTLIDVKFHNLNFLTKVTECCQLKTLRLTIADSNQQTFRKIVIILSKTDTLRNFRYEQLKLTCNFDVFLASLKLLPHLEKVAFFPNNMIHVPSEKNVYLESVFPNFPPGLSFLAVSCSNLNAQKRLCANLKLYKPNDNFSYYISAPNQLSLSLNQTFRKSNDEDYRQMVKLRTYVCDLNNRGGK